MNNVEWYYARGQEQCGPVSEAALRTMLGRGEIGPDTLVWRDGMAEWRSARMLPELHESDVPQPPPVNRPVPGQQSNPLAITSLVLGVLGLFIMTCALPVAIGGAICGHKALAQIRAEPERYSGRELAVVGLVLNYIALVISGIFILIFLIAMLAGMA